jgi:RHS repeat-associated protein
MGELLSVVTPTKNVTYQHNANSQRVAKLVNGTIREKYLWANLTTLLATYDKDDNLVQRFEYADQRMPVSMTKGSTKYYLHYDQVGSLRTVTDSSHNIVKVVSYDTYGNVLSDSNEAFTVPFGFAGGLYDTDTKLTRFGYRDYDARTGKWTAKDPIGFGGGDSNLYGYVFANPVGLVDFTGELAHVVGATVAGAVGGALLSLIDPCGGLQVPSLYGFLSSAAIGALGGFGLAVASPLLGIGIESISAAGNVANSSSCGCGN